MPGCHMQAAVKKLFLHLSLMEPYHITLLYVCSFLEKKAAACEMACKTSLSFARGPT